MNDLELRKAREELRAAGCGWKDGKYFKGTPEQQVAETELNCIEMINSILAYDCKGYDNADDVLEYEKSSYNYLKKYIAHLGESRVLELIQGQIDSINYVDTNVASSEGVSYNSIAWK